MVEGITDREALYLSDLLSQEATAVDKFSVFANESVDPEIRSVCRELANVHMRHFERLLQQVNVSQIGLGQNIGSSTRFTTTGTYSQGYTPSIYTQPVNTNVTGMQGGYGTGYTSSFGSSVNPTTSYYASSGNQGVGVSGSIGGTGYEGTGTSFNTQNYGSNYGSRSSDVGMSSYGYGTQNTGTRWS